jgi:hypothetical protein
VLGLNSGPVEKHVAERIEANGPQPGKRGPYKKRSTA